MLAVLTFPRAAVAQDTSDQFGAQQRADAASQMIVLAVQQAISSLPPTAGQSFSYTYDPKTLTFVANEQLGPTAFLSTSTVGKGKASFRIAASYFDISDSLGPILYSVDVGGTGTPAGYVKLGSNAAATAGVFNLSANYGIAQRIELDLNLPVTVVDAYATQSFTTAAETLSVPPLQARLNGAATPSELERGLSNGQLAIRDVSYEDLNFDFNSGTHAGVGRIGLGVKGVLLTHSRFRLAALGQLFLPSPSEDEFAGPASLSILPRLVGSTTATSWLSFITDVGYDYDVDSAELRRFVWNVGATIPANRFSFDLGVGGSQYAKGLQWTPDTAEGHLNDQIIVFTAEEDNQLGTTFVDFLAGAKVRLTDSLVLSGAVAVPLTDDGFRPAALGTIAVEMHL